MEAKNKNILIGVVGTLAFIAILGYASKGNFGDTAKKGADKLESTVSSVKSKVESAVS